MKEKTCGWPAGPATRTKERRWRESIRFQETECRCLTPGNNSGVNISPGMKRGDLIIGLTPIGRATIFALQMNNLVAVTVRRNWIAAGWHPPQT